mgnify:CR=1 FL=1
MSLEEAGNRVREGLLKEVGQPFGEGGRTVAPDPVNVPMIRHWVDALDDQNPIYLDDSAAQAAGLEPAAGARRGTRARHR